MTCEETGRLIHALADSELDLVHSVEIETHIRQCSSCTRASEEIQHLRGLMKDPSLRLVPTPNFEKRLRAALRAEAKEKRTTEVWWRWAVAGASLVIVVILAVSLAV